MGAVSSTTKPALPAVDGASKRTEDRDFLGARGAQVLLEEGLALLVEVLARRCHHLGRVLGGFFRRVDAAHREVRHAGAERLVEMGRGVRGREMHRVAEPGEGHGQSSSDGGLADPALAHRQDDAVPVAGQLRDE